MKVKRVIAVMLAVVTMVTVWLSKPNVAKALEVTCGQQQVEIGEKEVQNYDVLSVRMVLQQGKGVSEDRVNASILIGEGKGRMVVENMTYQPGTAILYQLPVLEGKYKVYASNNSECTIGKGGGYPWVNVFLEP